ncbi:hypothetical protein FA014_06600, partial [Cellulomonas hominis]
AVAVAPERASASWVAPTDRYERAGTEPAGAAPSSAEGAATESAAGAPAGGDAEPDERSTWDALSRGDDPT